MSADERPKKPITDALRAMMKEPLEGKERIRLSLPEDVTNGDAFAVTQALAATFGVAGAMCDRAGAKGRKGRKPANESRTEAICTRLVSWSQASEGQRPSLRVLAKELGTSHQLLSFYLKGLSKWRRKEYLRKAQEIRDKGLGMTYVDEQQAVAYERAAFQLMLDDALEPTFQRLEAGAKAGNLKPQELEMVRRAARYGIPRALKIKQDLTRRGLVLQ
jgi:hypothetical protein